MQHVLLLESPESTFRKNQPGRMREILGELMSLYPVRRIVRLADIKQPRLPPKEVDAAESATVVLNLWNAW